MYSFLERIKHLNLPKGKYAVFGSGPMGVRGLKDIGDLDIITTKDLYNHLVKELVGVSGWWIDDVNKNNHILTNGEIEISSTWCYGTWDINKLIQEADIIKDIPFVKLTEVLKYKKNRNAEKDYLDIKIIEDYLKTSSK
jgi:hypothetical protein